MKNQCNFIGRLGADPECKRLQSGKPVVNLRLACSEKWTDKNTGERKEITDWIPIVIFSEGLCGIAERYLRKGSLIDITGAFKTRKYQDQQGNDKYITEIILQGFNGTLTMLDGKGEGGSQGQSQPQAQQPNSGHAGAMADDMDDEIPFGPEWRA